MQSFVEARRGGETGVSRVQLLTGDQLKQAAAERRWSQELADLAMAAETKAGFQRLPFPVRQGAAQATKQSASSDAKPRHALIVDYKDGTRGTALDIGSTSDRWNFCCNLQDQRQPIATALYNGPWGNLCL